MALLATEGVTLDVHARRGPTRSPTSPREVNERTENIGARRLHTVMERLLDDLLFSAPEISGQEVVVTRPYVEERLAGIVKDADLSRYILLRGNAGERWKGTSGRPRR